MSDKKLSSKAGKELSKLGASKGGRARASVLTSEQRKEIARAAAAKRWEGKRVGQASDELEKPDLKKDQQASGGLEKSPSDKAKSTLPIALFPGSISIGETAFSCYVLDNNKRVLTQREVVRILSGHENGNLDRYIEAENMQDIIDPAQIFRQSIQFAIPGVHFVSSGYEATLLLDICDAYLRARDAEALKSVWQLRIAKQAEIITRACAKVGIIALIDEATGYEKFKAKRDLQIKLQAFISEDMQEWARMFPEEFWFELARLEGVRYSPRSRPLRWGKYVMMFVYDAIDGDVGKKLREINRNPHYRKNHHQWLKEFGREKVNNQIQKNLAIMKLCDNMDDFRKNFDRVFKNLYQRSFDDIEWGE